MTVVGQQPNEADTELDPPLVIHRTGAVARLRLNRPGTRNALSRDMVAGLTDELSALADNEDVGAIIIAAEGPVFSAGHHMGELYEHRGDADGGKAYFAEAFGASSALMMVIHGAPQPVIAEVGGLATAAGCQLVAACDLAVASDQARFATPGVDIGLFCSTPMVSLSRAVPRKAALKMLFTGEPVDASTAKQLGLVNDVVAPDQLKGAAQALAHRIVSNPRSVIALGKRAFYAQSTSNLAEAYTLATEVMVSNMLRDEAKEGFGAFLEKRNPEW